MKFLNPKTYQSIAEALLNPKRVKSIHLWIKKDMPAWEHELLKLPNLKELYLQGDPEIYEERGIQLSEILGELVGLRSLTLLNIPYLFFPTWIENLRNLKYLTVRGTDAQEIPKFIKNLSNLRILHVENCSLTQIPNELKELNKLKEIYLGDTMISNLKLDRLPKGIKKLGLGGPCPPYNINELKRIRTGLPKTRVYSVYDRI